jgi:hypothetical protein
MEFVLRHVKRLAEEIGKDTDPYKLTSFTKPVTSSLHEDSQLNNNVLYSQLNPVYFS